MLLLYNSTAVVQLLLMVRGEITDFETYDFHHSNGNSYVCNIYSISRPRPHEWKSKVHLGFCKLQQEVVHSKKERV